MILKRLNIEPFKIFVLQILLDLVVTCQGFKSQGFIPSGCNERDINNYLELFNKTSNLSFDFPGHHFFPAFVGLSDHILGKLTILRSFQHFKYIFRETNDQRTTLS